jgi:cellulose biosynthesis protein BcsQ
VFKKEKIVNINIYTIYNNKGGVGKTTLCQNLACLYAKNHPDKQVLVIDLCPQANISQFLLGGGHKGYKTNQELQLKSSRRNIVGFMDWLINGNSGFSSIKNSYSVRVSDYNDYITDNLYLIAGDSFLESLSLALNYAVINPANVNAWQEYMTSIRRLAELEFEYQSKNKKSYKSLTVFIDTNPSFSIYTQMGLLSSDRVIVPMMADFSSLEGIKGMLMLLYGKYPSSAQKKYAEKIITFSRKVEESGLSLPTLYEFVFNNFTANVGVAKAYESIKNELIDYCYEQWKSFSIFTPIDTKVQSVSDWKEIYVSDVKDLHTSGKVSASLGIPVHRLPERSSYTMPDGEPVKLPQKNYTESLNHIIDFVNKIE